MQEASAKASPSGAANLRDAALTELQSKLRKDAATLEKDLAEVEESKEAEEASSEQGEEEVVMLED